MWDLTVHFLCQLLIQHPLLFPMYDLLPWCCWVSHPSSLELQAIHLSFSAVHHSQTKAGKQEVPSTRGFQRARGAVSHCLPSGLFLQQACPQPQNCCSTRGQLLTDTQGHTQAHAGQRTAKKHFGCTLTPTHPVYDALKLTQTISAPHPPTDASPNPFRVKTQWLWLQSSSSIAKLHATEQPNISTLLVILLLQHCKRKKKVFFFLWWSCHCLEETCVLHTQKGTHTRISYGALQAAQNRKQLEENGYREMVLLGIICWFVLFIEGMRFLSLLKI